MSTDICLFIITKTRLYICIDKALGGASVLLKHVHTLIGILLQVRAKLSITGFGGPTEVTCGGNALKFYASMRLNVRRTGLVKKGDEVFISTYLLCMNSRVFWE